jgi:thiol:disulfide interchange protein DsbD
MPPFLRLLGLLFILALAPSAEASLKKFLPGNNQDFLPAEQALRLQVTEDATGLRLEFLVTPGHYLYRDRFRFEPLDTTLQAGPPPGPATANGKKTPILGACACFTTT